MLPADGVKHETLFQNEAVNAAGEIVIERGIVVDVNADSGTYTCVLDDEFNAAVREALANAGATLAPGLRKKLA